MKTNRIDMKKSLMILLSVMIAVAILVGTQEKISAADQPKNLKKSLSRVDIDPDTDTTTKDIRLVNNLPNDYKPQLIKLSYGIFHGEKNAVKGAKLLEDGTLLKLENSLKAGYYTLSIKDANGKYPSFDMNLANTDEYYYPGFSIYPKEAGNVTYSDGKISSSESTIADLRKNLISITVYSKNEDKILMNSEFHGGGEAKYINTIYVKNQIFTEDGKVNPDFKNQKGEKVFKEGKKYEIVVNFANVSSNVRISDYEVPKVKAKKSKPKKIVTTAKKSGITYKIIKGKKSVASVIKADKNLKKVSIVDTIKIAGKNYKVISIDNKVFKGQKKLGKATVGKNVSTIGREAFRNSKKLKTVIFKGKVVKKIGKKAFTGTYKKITVKAPKKVLKKYRKMLKKAGISKRMKLRKY